MVTVFAPQLKNPNYPCCKADQSDAIDAYLESRNFLAADESVVRVATPAHTPRNRTWRVETSARTFFLKQFLDWPATGRAAPSAQERFQAECQFYRTIRITDGLGQVVPAMLHHDSHANCLLLEDVGATLSHKALTVAESTVLAWFLVRMHHHSQSVPKSAHYRNREVLGWQMARLFHRNPRPTQPGAGRWLGRFAAISERMRHALEDAQAAMENECGALVHGDFTSSNWVRAADGSLRVVDAEFSFFGPAEFDVGAFLASLIYTRQKPEVLRAGIETVSRGCCRYRPRLAGAFLAVHLCAMFDVAPRGAASSALLRRVADAVAAGSFEPLL